jgi:phosphomannomutase
MPNTIYIFDVDGTVTPSREPMDEMFSELFLDWAIDGEKEVYFASGSDIEKIRQQLSEEVFHTAAGIFCCLGNQLWQKEKLIYQTTFLPSKAFFRDLQLYLDQGARYQTRTGNHVESRVGMVNFSVIGRNATPAQRKAYKQWDETNLEREDFLEYVVSRYPTIEASIGGEISVDIYPRGNDKSQVIKYLSSMEPASSYVFVGDRTDPGGNDYAIVQAVEKLEGSKWFKVNSWEDTRDLINSDEAFS